MSDLIERLREKCGSCGPTCECTLHSEAANALERLEQLRERSLHAIARVLDATAEGEWRMELMGVEADLERAGRGA